MRLPTWVPSAEVDAQMAHFGWGAFLVLAGLAWAVPGWAVWLLLMGWITVKEFGFDLLVEKDSPGSSAVDGAFYLLGGLLGWAAWAWH